MNSQSIFKTRRGVNQNQKLERLEEEFYCLFKENNYLCDDGSKIYFVLHNIFGYNKFLYSYYEKMIRFIFSICDEFSLFSKKTENAHDILKSEDTFFDLLNAIHRIGRLMMKIESSVCLREEKLKVLNDLVKRKEEILKKRKKYLDEQKKLLGKLKN